ncbi:hypothetical protein D3C71_1061820 [compost metagenome]
MHYLPLTIQVESASLLLPLEVGQQPQLDLTGRLSMKRALVNEDGRDISGLPWEITIERLEADEVDQTGNAFTYPHIGELKSVIAGYKASPQAFDRLTELFAKQLAHVKIRLEVSDVAAQADTEDLQWLPAAIGSPIKLATVYIDFS